MKEIVNFDIEFKVTVNGKPLNEFEEFTKELSFLLNRFQKEATKQANDADISKINTDKKEVIITPAKKSIEVNSKKNAKSKRSLGIKFVGAGDVFRKALKSKVGSLEEFAKKIGFKRRQALYGAIGGDYALTKERWNMIFEVAELTPVFTNNSVDIAQETNVKNNLTLENILNLAPLRIKDKVKQQFYIDKDIAYHMATTCRSINDCNNLLDRVFKDTQGVSSSLGIAMEEATE